VARAERAAAEVLTLEVEAALPRAGEAGLAASGGVQDAARRAVAAPMGEGLAAAAYARTLHDAVTRVHADADQAAAAARVAAGVDPRAAEAAAEVARAGVLVAAADRAVPAAEAAARRVQALEGWISQARGLRGTSAEREADYLFLIGEHGRLRTEALGPGVTVDGIAAAARPQAESAAAVAWSREVLGAARAAQPAADAAAAAAASHTVREIIGRSAEVAEAWRISAEAAAAEAARPTYGLPLGFADRLYPGGPALHPAWGVRGRIEQIADVRLGGAAGDRGVAELVGAVAERLPAAASAEFGPAVRREVADRFGALGSQEAGQLLAGDGMSFLVTADGRTYRVTAGVRLDRLDRAWEVPPGEVERARVPVGQKQGTGADQLSEVFVADTLSRARNTSVGLNPLAPAAWHLLGAGIDAGAMVSRAGGRSRAGSAATVVSSMQQLMYDGRSAYHDVPGSRITVDAVAVDPVTGRPLGPAEHAESAELTVRLGNPTETASPAAGPAPAGPLLGLPGHEHLEAAGAYPDPGTPGFEGRQEAVARIERVAWETFGVPRQIAGLERLRARILAQFPQHSQAFADEVRHATSEGWLLQRWRTFAGPGEPSAWLTVGAGTGQEAGLVVRAGLRSVQRVAAGVAQPKLESRIGEQVGSTDGISRAGSLGGSVRPGWTLGDQAAPTGGNHALGVGLTAAVRAETGLTTSGLHGGGEWRAHTAVGPDGTGEPVVVYRAQVRLTAEIETTRPGVRSEVGADGIVHLVVPAREAARFEAGIQHALDPAGHPPPPRHGGRPEQRPLAPGEPQLPGENRPEARLPPPEVEHNVGLGAAHVDLLSGAERVVPEAIDAVAAAERGQRWAAGHSPRARHQFRAWLGARFSPEALASAALNLTSRGIEHTYERAVPGGVERVTVEVSFRRDGLAPDGTGAATPPEYGRIEDVAINVIPTDYSGYGFGEGLPGSVRGAASAGGTGGAQALPPIRLPLERVELPAGGGPRLAEVSVPLNPGWFRTLTAAGGASYSRAQATSMSTEVFSFKTLGALFDPGPVRTFDYRGTYDVQVKVDYHPGEVLRSRPQKALHGLAQVAFRRPGLPAGPAFTQRAERTVTDGLVRYLVPEGLTPRPEAARATAPGATEVRGRDHPFTDAELGTPGAIRPDEMVLDVLGTARLRQVATDLLRAQGLDERAFANQVRTATSPVDLRAHLHRDPDGQLGIDLTDGRRHARLTLQATTLNERTATEAAPVRQLDIIESQPKVTSTERRSGTWAIDGSGTAGVVLAEQPGGGSQSISPGIGGDRSLRTWSEATTHSDTAVSGRWLTHEPRPYHAQEADVVWTVSVLSWPVGRGHPGGPAADTSYVHVEGGVRGLRPDDPAPGGRPPAGVPDRLTVDQIPGTSANYRLEFRPDGPPPSGATAAATPKDNPLVAAVQRLLHRNDHRLLTAGWTVDGTADRHGALPQSLHAMLSLGALEGHIDLLKGAGLVLRPAGTRWFGISRPYIVIRAVQDADGAGARYHQTLDDFSLGKYWTRYDKQELAVTATQQRGSNAGSGVGEKLPDRPANTPAQDGQVGSVDGGVAGRRGRSTSDTEVTAHTAIDRDTGRLVGQTDLYRDTMRLEIAYVDAARPSRFVNLLLGGAPAAAWSWARGYRDPAAALAAGRHSGRSEHLDLTEYLLVPRISHYTDTPGVLPGDPRDIAPAPEPPAVREVVPGPDPAATIDATPGLTRLPVTAADLADRKVHIWDIDHRAIRGLFDGALASFTGGRASPGETAGSAATVARLLGLDGGGPAALAYTLSYPLLTRIGQYAVADGYRSPRLLHEGGLFADTVGNVSIRYAFFDGRPLANSHPGYQYSERYHFDERAMSAGVAESTGADASAGPAVVAGDHLPAVGAEQVVKLPVSGGVTRTSESGEFVNGKQLRGTFRNLELEGFLPIRAGLMIEATVEAANQRGPLQVPEWFSRAAGRVGAEVVAERMAGGSVRLMFSVPDAVTLLAHPEWARARDFLHPQGQPIPAGQHFPSDTDVTPPGASRAEAALAEARRLDRLWAAYAMPAFGTPSPYPGAPPTLVGSAPGKGFAGWFTVVVDGFHPETQTVRYADPHGAVPWRDYSTREFAELIRDLPNRHGRPVILAAGGGARVVPAADGSRTSFAEVLRDTIGREVLATPDGVLLDPHGRVFAGEHPVDAAGAPLAGGRRPGNWVMHSPPADPLAGSPPPPQLYGDDLIQVVGHEVPDWQRRERLGAMPAVFPPPRDVHWGEHRGELTAPPDPGGLLLPGGAPSDIGLNLVAERRGNAVLVHRAGVAVPAEAEAWATAPAEPGRARVVVTDPGVWPDALLGGIQRLRPMLPVDLQGSIRLILPDGARDEGASLAQRIARREGVEVIAHEGEATVTGGAFVARSPGSPGQPPAGQAPAGQAPAGPDAQWQRFTPWQRPQPLGSRHPHGPS
jgi:hypothetical protein